MRPWVVQHLDASHVADRPRDRRADELAGNAHDDDREQLEVPEVDVVAGQQHDRLRGHRDPRGARDEQHEDPRVAEVVDDRRGEADKGVGDRRELGHGRRRVPLPAAMRVWVDLTNSPHPLVLRPVVERLRADGHQVAVTARDFAQTVELARRAGLDPTVIGHHRGGRLAAKATGLLSRSAALVRFARGRRFELALGHGSNDITVAAALLRIPSATMFDYEWAAVQHHVNCRLARVVVVPTDAIPTARLRRYGGAGKVASYPGLKEEYYLADFEPSSAVLDELGIDARKPLVVVRTPPSVSLYHRFENELFAAVLERVRGSQAVVLPRVRSQRAELIRAGGFIVPGQAIDAQSLIAFADLVISAGGTMNREAVALGTPVWTTFEGRMGAVDEALIASSGTLMRRSRAPRRGDRDLQAPSQRRPAHAPRSGGARKASARRRPGSYNPLMRRRLRSAAFPLHRHSLPQLVIDAGLVALAYYLAFWLRFEDQRAQHSRALSPAAHGDLAVGGRRHGVAARRVARLPATLALRQPARHRAAGPGAGRRHRAAGQHRCGRAPRRLDHRPPESPEHDTGRPPSGRRDRLLPACSRSRS